MAEEYVDFVNDNMFLKEFTYSDNEIKIDDGEIELADNDNVNEIYGRDIQNIVCRNQILNCEPLSWDLGSPFVK